MKPKRLIILLLCFGISIHAASQDTDSTDIYFEYELSNSGAIYNQIDTAYNVTLILDAADIKQFISIDFETEDMIKKVKVKPEDLEADPKVKIKKDKYLIDMDEWKGTGEFLVSAERYDGSVVQLKDKNKSEAVVHKVIDNPSKRRDLAFSRDEPVIEPIPIPEPEPEEPDTTAYRKK